MSDSSPGTSTRIRQRGNLLVVAYDPRFPNLKVTKKCRSHLAVMGVPGPNGDHFLWPEEAVYLLENCQAIVSKKDRLPMTVHEGYCMLAMKQVPFHKYLVYCSLKRAGFVVIRPRRLQWPHPSVDVEMTELPCTTARNQLLDFFPSLDNGQLQMPQLHGNADLVPAECGFLPDPSVLRFSKTARHQKPCRPAYWPSFSSIAASSTWAEYSQRKKAAIKRQTGKKLRKVQAQLAELPIDFEVYNTQLYSFNNRQLAPLFRVICLDAREPSSIHHHLLSKLADVSVVFALFDNGKIGFINSSGTSIDITRL